MAVMMHEMLKHIWLKAKRISQTQP